jgi:hypothetical protein
VKVLFVMRTPVYVRNYEPALSALAGAGHEVHVAFEDPRPELPRAYDQIEDLAARHPEISFGSALDLALEPGTVVRRRALLGLDYLRYLEPRYDDAPLLRARAERRAPRWVQALARRGPGRSPEGRERLRRVLRRMDVAIPTRPEALEWLRERGPDVLVVSPLVMFGSTQVEFVRAAKLLGIPTALPVYSWDNLTNKGLMPEVPDLVTVWNEVQRREAEELHGVPPERIRVTGAVHYDEWFGRAAATDREEFCARVGLRPDRPYLLFVGSSRFIAPDESMFVREWVRGLREQSADSRLREAGVLVRPHPLNRDWKMADVSDLPEVAVWPAQGEFPTSAEAKDGFADSLHHSAAVVGVNTSAMLEAAIVGRPVHTLIGPRFRDTQDGTLHFRHITDAGGGPVRVSRSPQEHARQLGDALSRNGGGDPALEDFLGSFLRPHGLDQPAAPRLVAALEELAGR